MPTTYGRNTQLAISGTSVGLGVLVVAFAVLWMFTPSADIYQRCGVYELAVVLVLRSTWFMGAHQRLDEVGPDMLLIFFALLFGFATFGTTINEVLNCGSLSSDQLDQIALCNSIYEAAEFDDTTIQGACQIAGRSGIAGCVVSKVSPSNVHRARAAGIAAAVFVMLQQVGLAALLLLLWSNAWGLSKRIMGLKSNMLMWLGLYSQACSDWPRRSEFQQAVSDLDASQANLDPSGKKTG